MAIQVIVLVVITLISCILFEYTKLFGTVRHLFNSYKGTLEVMNDKDLTDDAKQGLLMKQVGKQTKLLVRLLLGIALFISPFFSLYLLQHISDELQPDLLVSPLGIIVPILTVILYIFLKRVYGKLFYNR